jgi:hypothetical protein
MSDKAHKDSDGRFRLVDLLVILICLSGAVYSVNLFRLDLLRVFSLQNVKPVGFIVEKGNIVQRRVANRVLWDRLVTDSPAYAGDVIRTASLSSATLRIEDNYIEIDENTLIRILRSPGDENSYIIDLYGGSILVRTGSGSITINISGHQVKLNPNSVVNASLKDDNVVVQVNKGSASFIGGGRVRELTSGTLLSLDARGVERIEKAAMVTQPLPNARYLKSTPEPLRINFSWKRINLDPEDTIRLEIAADRSFNRIVYVVDNYDAAEAAFDAGFWYWRLSLIGTGDSQRLLTSGRLTVTDATGPRLLSPVTDSVFRYQNDLPRLRYTWSGIEEASSYKLEISELPDFRNPRLQVQTETVFLVNSSLVQGTWYWRVAPVFPAVYEGSAAFSSTSFFHIERGSGSGLTLILPETVPGSGIGQSTPEIEQWWSAGGSVAEIERWWSSIGGQPGPLAGQSGAEVEQWWSVGGSAAEIERWWSSVGGQPGSVGGQSGLTGGQSGLAEGQPGTAGGQSGLAGGQPGSAGGQSGLAGGQPGLAGGQSGLTGGQIGLGGQSGSVGGQSGLVSGPSGQTGSVGQSGQAISLLSAPGNLQPARGRRIGINELKTQNNITFTWSAVQGANAYIFTLYEETANGRRQIINRPPENRTNWTLDDLGALGRGTFVWQVEAVNRNSSSVIEQRGRAGESTFTLDVPVPGPVRIINPGILYGY